MLKVQIYLTFDGKTEEAFNFYKSIFGGEFQMKQTFGESNVDQDVPEDLKGRIMHVALPIGTEGDMLMGSDTFPGMGQEFVEGTNISVSLHPDSEEETKRIFEALSAGGEVVMPLNKTFWNALYGMCRDKFGINWMINYDLGGEQ
ncbi:VOC family protein [Candidatus Peregrinibacteria bacterium]|nr:VOC family protein [Candidatus Peregrinibacteria bacterium]